MADASLALPSLLPNLLRLGARQINSPLGVYNGDVYKVYFDRVRESNPHETTHPCTFARVPLGTSTR